MRLLEALHNYDLSTFDWCLRRKHLDALTTAGRCISKTADGHLYVLAILCLFLFGDNLYALALLAAFVIERPLYLVLKAHFKRNRPPQAIPGFKSVIEPSDQFSFPSGHTSAAFLFATFMLTLMPYTAWVLFPWAISVGMSRVVLGVHFPTDTVAGACLGTSSALISLSFIL